MRSRTSVPYACVGLAHLRAERYSSSFRLTPYLFQLATLEIRFQILGLGFTATPGHDCLLSRIFTAGLKTVFPGTSLLLSSSGIQCWSCSVWKTCGHAWRSANSVKYQVQRTPDRQRPAHAGMRLAQERCPRQLKWSFNVRTKMQSNIGMKYVIGSMRSIVSVLGESLVEGNGYSNTMLSTLKNCVDTSTSAVYTLSSFISHLLEQRSLSFSTMICMYSSCQRNCLSDSAVKTNCTYL